MLLLGGAAGAATWWLAGKMSRRQRAILGTCLTIAILGFGFFLSDSAWIARAIPLGAVVVYGNAMPVLAGMLAGVVLRSGLALWRRILPTAALAAIAGYSLFAPILARPPRCADRWKDGVCLQTSQASCGPAAAATLLAHHGIGATEQEMARLCLTEESGTLFGGLCRGIRVKTEGTPFRMTIGTGNFEQLRAGAELPALVSVRLTPDRTRSTWRWETHRSDVNAGESGRCAIYTSADSSLLKRGTSPTNDLVPRPIGDGARRGYLDQVKSVLTSAPTPPSTTPGA